ncbi:MAG: hypothetical protein WBL82_11395, partial [Terriglobales bacterium]
DNPRRKLLKAEYKVLLSSRIAERKVDFIGEEAKAGTRTIAQLLGHRTENIDMPDAEREAQGIAEEQRNRPCVPHYVGNDAKTELTAQGYQRNVGNGWVQLEARIDSDKIREQYMFERVTQEIHDAQSVIVICGIIHSVQLAAIFRRDSDNDVEVELWEPMANR